MSKDKTKSLLSGNLAMMCVADVVNSIYKRKATGSLRFSMPNKGKLYFKEGKIIHAELDNMEPKMAFYRMLNYDKGYFKFEDVDPKVDTTLEDDTAKLIEDGTKLVNEASSLLPSLHKLSKNEFQFLESAITHDMIKKDKILALWEDRKQTLKSIVDLMKESTYLSKEQIEKIEKVISSTNKKQNEAFALIEDFEEEEFPAFENEDEALNDESDNIPKEKKVEDEKPEDEELEGKAKKEEQEEKPQEEVEKKSTSREKYLKKIANSSDIGFTAKIRRRIEEEYAKEAHEKHREESEEKAEKEEETKPDNGPKTKPIEIPDWVREEADTIKDPPTRPVVVPDWVKSPDIDDESTSDWIDRRKHLNKIANSSEIGLTAKIKRSLARQKNKIWGAVGAEIEDPEEIGEAGIGSCLLWIAVIASIAILCGIFIERLFAG